MNINDPLHVLFPSVGFVKSVAIDTNKGETVGKAIFKPVRQIASNSRGPKFEYDIVAGRMLHRLED